MTTLPRLTTAFLAAYARRTSTAIRTSLVGNGCASCSEAQCEKRTHCTPHVATSPSIPPGDWPLRGRRNNQAERVLRPIVIGRKNWNFIGSEDATDWAPPTSPSTTSCRLAKVEPRAWLRLVIARLHAGDTNYAAMTPANCATLCPARVPPGDLG